MATAHARSVARIMSTHVVTAAEDSTLQEVSDLMLGRGLKRIPVVRDGAVVGIVSRVDLLRALLSLGRDAFLQERPGSQTADRTLRLLVADALEEHGWARALRSDVVVSEGTVHLWGVAPSEDLRDTYIRAAQNVPGVTGVHSRLQVAPRPSS
jgi:osmotically-inducible protein OsmY